MKNRVRRLVCKVIGHRWKYNFVDLPSKRVCKCCGKRQRGVFTTVKGEVGQPILMQIWE